MKNKWILFTVAVIIIAVNVLNTDFSALIIGIKKLWSKTKSE